MKFSTAWAKVAAQNVTLKVATVVLSIVSLVQLFIIGCLASRNLPIIERGCFSKIIAPKSDTLTDNEIKAFLLEALPMRFDSLTYLKDGFLSLKQAAAREKDQAALKERKITQRLVISDIKITGEEINVTADRLLTLGKIKSALTFNLKASVQKTSRSESNPYGLVLSSVSQIENKEDK